MPRIIAIWNACDSGNTIKNRCLGTFLTRQLNYLAGKPGIRQHLIEELACSGTRDHGPALPATYPAFADHNIPLFSRHIGIQANVKIFFNKT